VEKQSRYNKNRRLLIVLAGAGIIALLGTGYGALVRGGIGLPCLFYTLFGLRCPGCGISRGLAALLTGQADRFLEYNLLAPLIVFYILWVCFFCAKNYIKTAKWSYRSPCKWVDILTLVLAMVWWIVRNIVGL